MFVHYTEGAIGSSALCISGNIFEQYKAQGKNGEWSQYEKCVCFKECPSVVKHGINHTSCGAARFFKKSARYHWSQRLQDVFHSKSLLKVENV